MSIGHPLLQTIFGTIIARFPQKWAEKTPEMQIRTNKKQAARVGQPVESLLLAVPVHQRFEFIQHLFGGCLIFAACEEVAFQLRLRAGGADDNLAAIRQRCHADLSDDEGGFIALHIVNAELNTTMSVVNDVTRFVDGCVQVVECFYNCHFDRDALDFSRFTVHLRFFAQRVFQGKQEQENDTHDEVFRALIARNCSEHYKCACCIAEYVRNTWHKELSDEELVFLTIHLKRIRMGK